MMIVIPGFVVAILTFPGVILHEMAHKFFCDYFNIKVFEVTYFCISNTPGSVKHEPVLNSNHHAIIALAPLLINSLVALILAIPYISILMYGADFVENISLLDRFLIWVAFSCGFSALPSSTDLDSIPNDADRKYVFIKKIVNFLNGVEWVGAIIWMLLLLFVITLPLGRIHFVWLYIKNLL